MEAAGATHAVRNVAASTVLATLLWAPVQVNAQTAMGAEAVAKYNANPLTVAIPSTLKPQDVEEVMALAFIGRKWTVAQRSPEEVVGTLDHRGFKAKASLKVDGNVIKILNDSQYLSPSSGKLEPAVPRGWLRNLEKDLKEYISVKVGGK